MARREKQPQQIPFQDWIIPFIRLVSIITELLVSLAGTTIKGFIQIARDAVKDPSLDARTRVDIIRIVSDRIVIIFVISAIAALSIVVLIVL